MASMISFTALAIVVIVCCGKLLYKLTALFWNCSIINIIVKNTKFNAYGIFLRLSVSILILYNNSKQ